MFKSKRLKFTNKNKEMYLFVFLVSFLVMMICFLPVMIYCKGYVFYYGDFNSQQLMFYDHVQTAVKNGTLNYDWGTDLGSSYLGSYSFYLLGSPFFWITTLFPKGSAPYLIPWLLAVKTGVAGVTSYAYIRRFVQNKNACAIGALLYAMSGFQIYNVFFNHFHDVTAFFPLMLLALEMTVVDDKRGVFALVVALMATVSYFFFAGEVVFLILYFICRCFSKDFKLSVRKIVRLGIESVLGVAMACFMLLPSALYIIDNPRLTEELTGLDLVVYDDKYRILRIIQSFFMASDPPARSNLFASDTARWASIAGYLPMYSMTGVIAFFKTKNKHWAKRLVTICIIFAFVPILNSTFVLFNSSYYARWFYMPVLIMAMMTAYVIEQQGEEHEEISLKKGIPLVSIVLGVILVISYLPIKKEYDLVLGGTVTRTVFFEIAQYPDLFIIQFAVTALTFLMLVVFLYIIKSKKHYYTILTTMTVVAIFANSFANIIYCNLQGPYPEEYTSMAINGGDQVDMEKVEGEFYRLDTSQYMDNYCMFWGYSSMRCFQSVVSTSIMEFYQALDITRDVASRIDTDFYQLRSLLSVKYYVNNKDDELTPPKSFSQLKETEDFIIYENDYYLPMGFAYDHCILQSDFDELSQSYKVATLMNSLVLSEHQYEKYGDIITFDKDPNPTSFEGFKTSYEERKAESCYYFKEDNDGFTAKISLDEDKLVFFSVPYEKGFSATVNGESVQIERVSNGMMAVRVPAGEDSVIRFDYETYGFKAGVIISLSAVGLFIIYIILARKFTKRKDMV